MSLCWSVRPITACTRLIRHVYTALLGKIKCAYCNLIRTTTTKASIRTTKRRASSFSPPNQSTEKIGPSTTKKHSIIPTETSYTTISHATSVAVTSVGVTSVGSGSFATGAGAITTTVGVNKTTKDVQATTKEEQGTTVMTTPLSR